MIEPFNYNRLSDRGKALDACEPSMNMLHKLALRIQHRCAGSITTNILHGPEQAVYANRHSQTVLGVLAQMRITQRIALPNGVRPATLLAIASRFELV